MRLTFSTLREALTFLAEHLTVGDREAVASACDAPPGDAEEAAWWLSHQAAAIAQLVDSHVREDLRLRYSGREFPLGAERFKLGGHASELGHLHIDFRRTAAGWVLEKIWICR